MAYQLEFDITYPEELRGSIYPTGKTWTWWDKSRTIEFLCKKCRRRFPIWLKNLEGLNTIKCPNCSNVAKHNYRR